LGQIFSMLKNIAFIVKYKIVYSYLVSLSILHNIMKMDISKPRALQRIPAYNGIFH
jgi:hypothetical protein